jgi:hypothetical protein
METVYSSETLTVHETTQRLVQKYSYLYIVSNVWSHRVPAAVVWVLFQMRLYEICGGQTAAVAGFLRVFLLSLPIFILSNVRHPFMIVKSIQNNLETDSVVK